VFEYVFINGRLVIESKARIPVKDRGFLYGDGLYETLRGFKGNLFMLDAHIQRLFHSLKALRYRVTFDTEYLRDAVIRTVKKNSLTRCDSYIKIIVTRGIHKGDLHFAGGHSPSLIIIAEKLKPYPAEDYIEGINIISSSIKRQSVGRSLYSHKLINYFENIFAKDEAHKRNAGEAVFLTKDRLVLEGASSNIFMVKRGAAYTPPLTQNILPGVTREVAIDICRENRIKIKEKKIHYRDIINADEVFKTSSVAGVVPVRKIDWFAIGKKLPGNITLRIMELYESRIDSSDRTVYK
jgi:branched-chain amino acid aminotransferase